MKADVRELVEAAKLVPFQIAASADVTPAWPAPLDLPALSRAERRRIRHIVRDWLPEGEVTLLAGHGGAGKSLIALLLAVCIALGLPWYGIPTERRHVVYVSAEDGRDVLGWRLDRICAYLGVDMAELDGWLSIIDASAIDAELIVDTRDGPMLTRMYGALPESIGDAQVLIIDGASDTYGANEIVRRSVRQFIRALRRLIPPDGAVLVLAHVDKAIARGRERGDHYSGSTAWNNSVRARWALRAEGDGLMLTVEKANHAQAGAEIRLRWDPQAHLHVADDAPVDGGMVGAIRDRVERDGILAAIRECAAADITVPSATSGRRTTYHVLASQPSFPAALRGESRALHGRFWRHIEALRQCCTLRECSIRTPARKWVGVLTLTTEEPRQCANAASA